MSDIHDDDLPPPTQRRKRPFEDAPTTTRSDEPPEKYRRGHGNERIRSELFDEAPESDDSGEESDLETVYDSADDSGSETEDEVPLLRRPRSRHPSPPPRPPLEKKRSREESSSSAPSEAPFFFGSAPEDEEEEPLKKRRRLKSRTPQPERPLRVIPPQASSSMSFELITLPCQPPEPPPQLDPEEEEEVPEEPERWYYATASKYEPDDTGKRALVWVDLVEAEWFDEHAAMDRRDFHQQHRWTPLWELEFHADNYRHEAGVPTVTVTVGGGKFDIQEGIWFSARVSSQASSMEVVDGDMAVECRQQFPSLKFGPEQTWWVKELKPLEGQEKDLARIYAILPEDSTGQQSVSHSQHVSHVGVFDIGQGSCNALFDEHGHPFLYFDFGLGDDKSHKYTRPASFQPCMAGNPVVILSHFDTDHRQLAVEKPQALHLPWLVIENKPVASDRNFFNQLTHVRVIAKNQLCFEEYPWGFVLRADWPGHYTAADKNEIGLVALVRVQDDSSAPPFGQRRALDAAGTRPEIFPEERYVLITGDAMFQYIASCKAHDLDGKVVGLLAAHHGAKDGLEEEYIPLAAPPLHGVPPTVVFSYGIFFTASKPQKVGSHGYAKNGGAGHPFPEAVDMYRLRGYHYTQKTAEDIDVTFINSHSDVIVVHPNHGRDSGDEVTLSGAVHAAYNAGPLGIHVLDEDHYTFPVARDPTLRYEPNVVATTTVQIFDVGANDWRIIWKPAHGLTTGANVAIAGTANDHPAVAVEEVDDDDYVAISLPGAPLLPGSAEASGTLNGAPVRVFNIRNHCCLVRHVLHGLDPSAGPQVDLNGMGLQPVVVLDEDHYVYPGGNNTGAVPEMDDSATAGVRVKLIALPQGSSLVVDPGPPRATPAQVLLRKYSGGPFPSTGVAANLGVVDATLPGYYTVDDCHHKDDASPMRMSLGGVLGERRHCLLGWRGPTAPPAGSAAATNIQHATAAYSQAAAHAQALYTQFLAADVIARAAEAENKIAGRTGADVATRAATAMTQAAFLGHQPTEATRSALRDAIHWARKKPKRNDAYHIINNAAQRLRKPAIRASLQAERLARDAVDTVHANGGLPQVQTVHCQLPPHSQQPVAAKPVPEPVLGIGRRASGTAMPPAGGAPATEPSELLTLPAGECLVHQPAHGLTGTKQVRLRGAGGAPLDGDRTATFIDANHYRLDASANVGRVHTLASVGLAVLRVELPEGQCLLHHPGQGATLGYASITDSPGNDWDGAHEVVEIIDADHYKLEFTHAAAKAQAAKVNGTVVSLEDDGAKYTVVEHKAHGRGLGPVVVTEASDATLDGPHIVTEIIDATRYRTDKTAALPVNATAKLNGVDVTLDADPTGCVVTHATPHQRGLRMVQVESASQAAYDGFHNVAENLDADWSRLDFSLGAAADITAQVAGHAVSLVDKAPTECVLRESQPGGHWATTQVELAGSSAQALDGSGRWGTWEARPPCGHSRPPRRASSRKRCSSTSP
ncbi:hypothetical protein ACLEPN_02835 [Myxococcus sp. 1LA]